MVFTHMLHSVKVICVWQVLLQAMTSVHSEYTSTHCVHSIGGCSLKPPYTLTQTEELPAIADAKNQFCAE